MSQRGGSVVTYVKYGDAVYSPIVDRGTADLILAFEPLEAYRALPYLKQGGKMIANTQQIDPMPVIIGAMAYPEHICEKLDAVCDLTAVDALQLAVQAGSQKCVNVVLIGVMAKCKIGKSRRMKRRNENGKTGRTSDALCNLWGCAENQ